MKNNKYFLSVTIVLLLAMSGIITYQHLSISDKEKVYQSSLLKYNDNLAEYKELLKEKEMLLEQQNELTNQINEIENEKEDSLIVLKNKLETVQTQIKSREQVIEEKDKELQILEEGLGELEELTSELAVENIILQDELHCKNEAVKAYGENIDDASDKIELLYTLSQKGISCKAGNSGDVLESVTPALLQQNEFLLVEVDSLPYGVGFNDAEIEYAYMPQGINSEEYQLITILPISVMGKDNALENSIHTSLFDKFGYYRVRVLYGGDYIFQPYFIYYGGQPLNTSDNKDVPNKIDNVRKQN